MTIFDLLTFIIGLAFSLFGMQLMSSGLEKMSGGVLERTLEQATKNRITAIAIGAGVTALVQSSSATTVMVVGFVNAGIMKLNQVVGIIMGANIGTTITSWILSLSGIEGSSIILTLLKPTSFSPIFALIGIIMMLFSQKEKKKTIGTILVSFAVLMYGMNIMGDAVAPLAEDANFARILVMFRNPILGVLVGTLFTGIIQSSAATVGILIALANALTGTDSAITYGVAIPIVLGSNIGTCVTALISCIGANKNAKRAAAVHLYFNAIGTLLFLTLFYILDAIFSFSFINQTVSFVGIALVHTVFNIVATIVFYPFPDMLCRLAEITIKDDKKRYGRKYRGVEKLLDDRFLNTPSFALEQCKKVANSMAQSAHSSINRAISLIFSYSDTDAEYVRKNEQKIDEYEDLLGTYMVKLSSRAPSEKDSHEISKLLHVIGDFERIGDHALNILGSVNEMRSKGIRFSDAAYAELKVMTDAVLEILEISFTAFHDEDTEIACKVEPLEEVVDGLQKAIRDRHIIRLQEGSCTIPLGFVLSDLINNMERVSDHCSNIAVAVLQINPDSYDAHGYIQSRKSRHELEYDKLLSEYSKQYSLRGPSA